MSYNLLNNNKSLILDNHNLYKILESYSFGLNIDIDKTLSVSLPTKVGLDQALRIIGDYCSNLISVQDDGYDIFAGRLIILSARYQAFSVISSKDMPLYTDYVRSMLDMNLYDPKVFSSKKFLSISKKLNDLICHDRDLYFTYSGAQQITSKYLILNRHSKKILESPQFMFMSIASTFFCCTKDKQKDIYKNLESCYNKLSNFKLSYSTPIFAGLRSNLKQFSACILQASDDDLDSINAVASTSVKYVSRRGGIGIDAGRLRAVGSPIRGGEAVHTGLVPFIKYWQSGIKSCSQGGVRSGSATVFFPMWHYEIETLIVLKNNRGVEDNRARHIDYCVQINKYLYSRLIEDRDISLFNPMYVPGLYDAFHADQEKFAYLYEKYELDESIPRITVRAMHLFSKIALERMQTGRLYIQHVDHSNTHSSFIEKKAPITQSNLCMEITLPTKPIYSMEDKEGEIGLCILGAINLGKIDSLEELESSCEIMVRSLDNIIDYQNYLHPAAKRSTFYRRSLGIGVTNLAYYIAKNGLKYSDGSANTLVHETMEAFQYFLLKASNKLAREKGTCPGFKETKYYLGLLPIDHYKKQVDEICNCNLQMDWEGLRKDIKKYGLRNSTLSAIMPCESTSLITSSTNGIELPRSLLSIKANKDGQFYQLVPEAKKLANAYEFMFDPRTNDGYIKICAIIQKFIDQAISVNTSYDPSAYANNRVPISVILEDMLLAYRYGLKTMYYCNTKSDSTFEYIRKNGNCSSCAI